MRVILDTKLVSEIKNVQFDFTSQLAANETLSTEVVTCTVFSGTDSSPSSMISGSASASGAVVTQLITLGTVGVTYELKCVVTTSGGQTLVIVGFLTVTQDLA